MALTSAAGVFGYAESDEEDELPPGWEERTTMDGKVYYANHAERTTEWTHPRTGKKKRLVGDLPPGWDRKTDEDGRVVFINHIDAKTTYTDPRLAFAVEENANNSQPPRQKFDSSTKAMQILHGMDLEGRTFLITGGNCGIGFETARCLAIHNAHVVLACRNVGAGEQAADKIREQKVSANVDVLECDLTSLRSVRQCARQFVTRGWPLHCLILNAAVFAAPYEISSELNLESTFLVNHLAQFYLTKLLMRPLVDSAPARVVVLSSESHRGVEMWQSVNLPLDLEMLSPSSPAKYWWLHAYNLSKLCNVWFALELNKRLFPAKISVCAVHPGNLISTRLSRRSCTMRTLFALVRPFTKSLQQGAATTIFAAASADMEGVGGVYLNNCWFCEPSKLSQNETAQKELFEISDQLISRFESGGDR